MPPIPAAFFCKGENKMIHQYKLGGYNIVLDVCSGSVHAVDEVAYDIIALFEENSREEILLAMEENILPAAIFPKRILPSATPRFKA